MDEQNRVSFPLVNSISILLALTLLFLLGAGMAKVAPENPALPMLTLALILGMGVIGKVKGIRRMAPLLLVAVALFSGFNTAQWVQPSPVLVMGMALVGVILLPVSLIAAFGVLDLRKHTLVLAVLAIVFSLLGGIFVYQQAHLAMIAVWIGAAVLCFSLLQCNTLRAVFASSGAGQPAQIAGGVFLINLGLLANLSIGMIVFAV